MNVPKINGGSGRMRAGGWLERLLFRSTDIASVAFFRFAFGTVMVWEVLRYLRAGRIGERYHEPGLFFTYYGFSWVQPWPEPWLHVHFIFTGLCAAGIALGWYYRSCTILFFLGFSYIFLLDQTNYLNHFYLVCILALLMIFIPANRAFAEDAVRRPEIRSDILHSWCLLLLRCQLGIVYVYAGIAKVNPDWLRGEPVRTWLSRRTDYPVFGPWLDAEWVVYLVAYGGLLFDLFVVPLLLWKRTRTFAFVLAIGFHLGNSYLFNIGIFPWMMIAATTLFFAPDWPRRLAARIPALQRALEKRRRQEANAGGKNRCDKHRRPWRLSPHGRGALVGGLLATWLGFQVLVPLRHWLYPGNVAWTDEGHRFSWRMMLRSKSASAVFVVRDGVSGEMARVFPHEYLHRGQARKMPTRPDMVLQFAHFLADHYREKGYDEVEVYAEISASLNARPRQPLIDPYANLAARERSLRPAAWVLPLDAKGDVD